MSADPIARFSTRLQAQRPTGAADVLGGAPRQFTDAGAFWAAIEPAGVNPQEGEEGLIVRARLRVIVRAPSPVRPGWRLLATGRRLRVLGREEGPLSTAPSTVTLICEEDQS